MDKIDSNILLSIFDSLPNSWFSIRLTCKKFNQISDDLDPNKLDGFVWSCENGKLESVQKLLYHKKVDKRAERDLAIRRAFYNGHSKIVDLLLKTTFFIGFNFSPSDLKVACIEGHIEVVKIVLGDIRFNSACLIDSFDSAVICNNIGIAELLSNYLPEFLHCQQIFSNETLIVQNKNIEYFKKLLESGKLQWEALICNKTLWESERVFIQIVDEAILLKKMHDEFVLKQNSSVAFENIPTEEIIGKIAYLSIEYDYFSSFKKIIEAVPNIDLQNFKMDAFSLSCTKKNLDFMKLILKNDKIDINKYNYFAFKRACDCNNFGAIRILTEHHKFEEHEILFVYKRCKEMDSIWNEYGEKKEKEKEEKKRKDWDDYIQKKEDERENKKIKNH